MLTHGFWFLTCDALAVYRLTILITRDVITDPLRNVLRNLGTEHRTHWLFELATCPWCISIWLAAIVVALTRFAPDEWQYGAMFLALSGVAGFMGER